MPASATRPLDIRFVHGVWPTKAGPCPGPPLPIKPRDDPIEARSLEVGVETAQEETGTLDLGHRTSPIGLCPDTRDAVCAESGMHTATLIKTDLDEPLVQRGLGTIDRHGSIPPDP